MENLGDWLYVVIIAIAGISSIISSTRKKAKEAAQQVPPREIIENEDEDDFWGEVAKDLQLPETKPVQTVPKQQSFQPIQKQSKYNFFERQEGQPSIVKNETTSFLEPTEEEENIPFTFEDLPENAEGWRKALVYNEILNRKY